MADPLYNERMKALFGLPINPASNNSPVKNLRVTADTLKKMEQDQLDATHDSVDRLDEQIELLKKIEKSLRKMENSGGGGGGLGSLLGGVAAGSLFKGGIGKLFGRGMRLPGAGTLFGGTTRMISQWSRRLTGVVSRSFRGITTQVTRAGGTIVRGATRSAKLMSSTILRSVTGFLTSLGTLVTSNLSNIKSIAKGVASKAFGPALLMYQSFDAISNIPNTKEGIEAKIADSTRKAEIVNKKIDDYITTPSEYFKSLTGKETPLDYFAANKSKNSRGRPSYNQVNKNAPATTAAVAATAPVSTASQQAAKLIKNEIVATAIGELGKSSGVSASTAVRLNVPKAIEKVADNSDLTTSLLSGSVSALTFMGKQLLDIKKYSKTLADKIDVKLDTSASIPIGAQANTAPMTGNSDSMALLGDEPVAGSRATAKEFFKPKQLMQSPTITQQAAIAGELQQLTNGGPQPAGLSGSVGTYKSLKSTTGSVTAQLLTGKSATPNAQSWHSFFTKPKDQGGMGWSPEVARGMIATMQGESGQGLNPAAYNPNDNGLPSGGTAQWRGPRLEALKQHAASMGLDWTDKSAQQSFFKKEMSTTHAHVNKALSGARTAEEALDIGVRKFEVPRDPNGAINTRSEYLKGTRSNAYNPVTSGLTNPDLNRGLSTTLPNNGMNTSAIVKQTQQQVAGIRRGEIDPALNSAIAQQVLQVFGPGYKAEVYSGGQPSKAEGGSRTGSTRHDKGRAGDLKIMGPDGKQITSEQYARLGQSWIANKQGGFGMQMKGGGVHIDNHKDRASFWDYNSEGGIPVNSEARKLIELGQKGVSPDYKMTPEQALAALNGNPASVVKVQSLRDASKGVGGLARLVGRDGVMRTGNSSDPYESLRRGSSRAGLGGGIEPLLSEKMLNKQGNAIAKGIIEGERLVPKTPELNPNNTPSSIMSSIETPAKNSAVAASPKGSSSSTIDKPYVSDIPHTDELQMLMANSQMMA